MLEVRKIRSKQSSKKHRLVASSFEVAQGRLLFGKILNSPQLSQGTFPTIPTILQKSQISRNISGQSARDGTRKLSRRSSPTTLQRSTTSKRQQKPTRPKIMPTKGFDCMATFPKHTHGRWHNEQTSSTTRASSTMRHRTIQKQRRAAIYVGIDLWLITQTI